MTQLINTTIHIIETLMQNQAHILTLVSKLMTKITNLKLMILLECQNIVILKAKKLVEHFANKNYKNQIKKNLELIKW